VQKPVFGAVATNTAFVATKREGYGNKTPSGKQEIALMPVPFLAAALVAPLAIAAPAPLKQDAASVRAFIGTIYAGYTKDGPGARIDLPELYFEPVLAEAIRKDADQAAAAGDQGKIDVDPFCACQDFEAIVPAVAVPMVGAKRATAMVSFTNFGERVALRYDLVWTAKGWRIRYITSPSGAGSFRVMFLS
jgi:hypothetical protein